LTHPTVLVAYKGDAFLSGRNLSFIGDSWEINLWQDLFLES